MAIKAAVTSSEHGYSQAREVQTVAQQTGSLIEKMQAVTQQSHAQATSIKTATESVRQLTETISNATAQQLSSSSQVLEALKDLTNVVEWRKGLIERSGTRPQQTVHLGLTISRGSGCGVRRYRLRRSRLRRNHHHHGLSKQP